MNARWIACLGLLLVILSWWLQSSAWLPGPAGTIGHDYAYFMPRLLAGAEWIEHNGLFSVPWFSPAFGAGLPAYAHPANGHFSLPQWLCLLLDPLQAVRWTAMLAVVIGYWGMWLWLRHCLKLAPWAALLGALLFALNGFHVARMAIGHLAFHSSMLAPLIAYWCMRERQTRMLRVRDGLFAGLAAAYCLQSGNVYGFPAVLLAVLGMALLMRSCGFSVGGFGLRLALTITVAVGLSLAKLVAGLALLSSFPRSAYPLPGADSWTALLELVFRALFFEPPVREAREHFVQQLFPLGLHEWDLGLSVVPLIVIGVALLLKLRGPWAWQRAQVWASLGLLALCAGVLALNLHGAAWERVLKSLPLVGSSSSFVRWLWIFIPLVSCWSALALEQWLRQRGLRWSGWALCLAFCAWQSLEREPYYQNQPYDPAPLIRAWHEGGLPPIREVVIPEVVDKQIRMRANRDDECLRGASQLFTYEPLFGYRLEWFPQSPVRPGAATVGNFHYPLAFLYPESAARAPGQPFRAEEAQQLDAFLRYQPLEVAWPARQRWANALNLLALVLVLGGLLYTSWLKQRSSSGSRNR